MAEYIDRDAVYYQLLKQATIDGQPRAIRRAAKIVANFPAANVADRETGKWIEHQQWQWVYAKCSKCETVFDVKSNFCPNCGADMREKS